MSSRAAAAVAVLLASAALLTGCSSPAPTPTATPVTRGDVPATTQEVVLVTPLTCKELSTSKARFAPLKVEGPGYATTVRPLRRCTGHHAVSTLVYAVPMPAVGAVTVTPGNQDGPKLNAALVAKQHGRTVYYGSAGGARYIVTKLVVGDPEHAA